MLANREALAMVQSLRTDIRGVLEWQKSVLTRVEQLCPSTSAGDVTMVDFEPDAITTVDAEAFRFFIEASVNKLSRVIE